MHVTSRWTRAAEMILWAVGIALLAIAIAATWYRQHYQSQQRQELFERASAPAGARTERSAARTLVEEPEATAQSPEPRAKPRTTRRPAKASDPLAIGVLEIPRLGVSAVVREGADESTLVRAVGLVPGTAHPGEGGNVVLAGHRDTFFRPLRNVRASDRIRFVGRSGTFEYRVRSARVVSANETSVLASRGTEELTLVTCYPFGFVGSAPDRFVVVAARVE